MKSYIVTYLRNDTVWRVFSFAATDNDAWENIIAMESSPLVCHDDCQLRLLHLMEIARDGQPLTPIPMEAPYAEAAKN